MKSFQSKGFTLIELMVTLSIIVMLAAVALPSLKFYKQKATAAKLIHLAGGVVNGLETYYSTSGNYSDLSLASPEGGIIMTSTHPTGAVAPIMDGITWGVAPQGNSVCVEVCESKYILGIEVYKECVTVYSEVKQDSATGIEVGFERIIDTGPEDRFGFNRGTPPNNAIPNIFTP